MGTSAAAVTAAVAGILPYKEGPLQFSTAAAIVGVSICIIGLVASFFLTEPNPEQLAD